MSQMSRQDPLIENHTVDYVPLAERHGKARDLFTLWFSTNIAPLPIVTGAMVVQVFHLNLFWGLLAIALGHMVGGLVIALASAEGPRMGIPQMVQSRGQFGRYGALLIVFLRLSSTSVFSSPISYWRANPSSASRLRFPCRPVS